MVKQPNLNSIENQNKRINKKIKEFPKRDFNDKTLLINNTANLCTKNLEKVNGRFLCSECKSKRYLYCQDCFEKDPSLQVNKIEYPFKIIIQVDNRGSKGKQTSLVLKLFSPDQVEIRNYQNFQKEFEKIDQPNSILLFPTKESKTIKEQFEKITKESIDNQISFENFIKDKIKYLIIFECTWSTSSNLSHVIKNNDNCIKLGNIYKTAFWLRQFESEYYLSTIEATLVLMREFEQYLNFNNIKNENNDIKSDLDKINKQDQILSFQINDLNKITEMKGKKRFE